MNNNSFPNVNKKPKNIEQLYSESFNNFRVEPSSGLWKSISTKLAWRNFFSFNPTTLNAYYLAGILAVATAGALLITKPAIENNQEIKDVSINKTIENSVITPMQENETEPKGITIPEERRKSEAGSLKQEANNQKPKSGINDQTTSNQKPDSSINDLKLVTRNPELITPILEPVTRNPELVTPKLATPHPASSAEASAKEDTDLPDPWPNTMDSLFTNFNSPTPVYTIEFPNAFTPNTNGPTNGYYTPGLPNNDVFHPVYKGVTEYHLSIFNRRGELIFESNEITIGWDGYINSRLATQGVYVWKAHGKYSNGQNFIEAGNVMLIIK